ncbi:MAG: AAA family ATPase, partial [Armatimonadota bacterium]|nr:AAA family ATPase [Armatimonadota bacterium]
MIVAIAGPIGVGKSTVARQLAERLGVRVVSAGEVFRDLARQRGLSVLELNRAAEDDPSLDREVDRLQAALARQGPCV